MILNTYHKPVLLDEAISYLISDTHGIYVDGTLGGGGHSARILDHLASDGRLYAMDQDEDALEYAAGRFKKDDRISLIRGNFGFFDVLLPKKIHGNIRGILLDLGVSSHQIDEPERGFSFQADGPLDMRMGSLQTTTAAGIVNEYEYARLRDLFFEYGEERQSARIARAVLESRPLKTTAHLREAIASVVPDRFLNKSLARIFQALRIEVNDELKMLKRVLEKGHALLGDRGRMVVITYHSLEDRLCKNFFRYGNFEGRPEKDFYGNTLRPMKMLHKKIISVSTDEAAANPRSRSAKLRAAEKLPAGKEGRQSETGPTKPNKRGRS
ncbi:MAG: 16S rRNA (cytosine(1402)-N(4))-methyltransferase RsmH [Balneolales bacterium]